MTFLNDKRWELALAAVIPIILPIVDAYQSGQFHGKSVADGLVLAAIIAIRALASHRQTAPTAPVAPPAPAQ